MPRGLAAVASICALACAIPAQARAAPAWLSPLNLSAPGADAEAPDVAVDTAGDATAVWDRPDGTHTVVEAATRPAGGAWGQAIDLSATGQNATKPRVAVDAAGDAVAVWLRNDGSHDIVQAAWRPAGGSWGSPRDLSAEGQTAKSPDVAIDPAGNATAVWSHYDGTKYIVQSSARPPQGEWEMPPHDLSEKGQTAEDPRVAVDAAGDALAVWTRFDSAHFIVQTASRPAGGAWGSPDSLSAEGASAEDPQLAVAPGGEAVAVWSRFDGTDDVVQSATRPAGGAWAASGDLSATGLSAETPQVAIDPAGDAVAVWARQNGGVTTIVQGSERPAGGAWEQPVPLSATGLVAAEDPEVAIDPAGNAIAVWSISDGSPNIVQAAGKPAGGPWQPRTTLSVIGRNSTEPALAMDPAGNGVAVWARENGTNKIVQAIGYDGSGPLIRGLSIPTAGSVHQPLSFSVSPFDVWSPLGPVSWSFGDGESGSGAALRHAFGLPGVYPVAVTAADALGNSSSAAGAVTIYPKPSASRNVRVRGRRALLRLRCPSPVGCEGTLRLVAGVALERRGRAFRKRMEIGATSFQIPGATTTTVPVPLTGPGRRLVREAPPSGVKAQLTGPGVKHRLVALFGPHRHKH